MITSSPNQNTLILHLRRWFRLSNFSEEKTGQRDMPNKEKRYEKCLYFVKYLFSEVCILFLFLFFYFAICTIYGFCHTTGVNHGYAHSSQSEILHLHPHRLLWIIHAPSPKLHPVSPDLLWQFCINEIFHLSQIIRLLSTQVKIHFLHLCLYLLISCRVHHAIFQFFCIIIIGKMFSFSELHYLCWVVTPICHLRLVQMYSF